MPETICRLTSSWLYSCIGGLIALARNKHNSYLLLLLPRNASATEENCKTQHAQRQPPKTNRQQVLLSCARTKRPRAKPSHFLHNNKTVQKLTPKQIRNLNLQLCFICLSKKSNHERTNIRVRNFHRFISNLFC